MDKKDAVWMGRAIALARKGEGFVSPNPLVGCVIVRSGRIVGEGYHARYGGPHAEDAAITAAGSRARGAALYTNLEPCSHWGNTPPCVDKIIAAGISRVAASVRDPNPLVGGRGFAALRESGIKVDTGCMAGESRRLNEQFFLFMLKKRPLVVLKAAITLDGKIATRTGESRWISGPRSREYAHRMRAKSDAVLVGVNTVIKDDPLLTVRGPAARGRVRQPLRVVLDSRLRIPLNAKIISSAAPTLVAACRPAAKKLALLRGRGAEVVVMPADRRGRVALRPLLRELALRHNISRLLVEGGGEVHASFMEQGLADRLALFISPKIFGGALAPGFVGGRGISRIASAWKISGCSFRRLGEDLLVEGRFLA